jgi:hypothetical protein
MVAYDFGDLQKNERAEIARSKAVVMWQSYRVRLVFYDGQYAPDAPREGVIYDIGNIRCYLKYLGREAAEKRKERGDEYDFSIPWHAIKEIDPIGRRVV